MSDWSIPEDYEFAKHLTPDRLAWEFLRRNPDYQAYWDDAQRYGGGEFILRTYGEKWGLAKLIDPEEDDPESLRWRRITRPRMVRGRVSKGSKEIVLAFDPTLGVDQQTQEAKLILKAQIKWLTEKGRIKPIKLPKRKGDYSLYLRLLDARQQGQSYGKIAKTLFQRGEAFHENGLDKAKKTYKQAKKIRDSDYRKLVMKAKI